MKRTITQTLAALTGVAILLPALAPNQALAFGPSKPKVEEISNKSEYLEAAIREFNEKYSDVSLGSTRTDEDFGQVEMNRMAGPWVETARNELCSRLAPVIAPGTSCSDLVQVRSGVYSANDSSYSTPNGSYFAFCASTLGIGCIVGTFAEMSYQFWDKHQVYSPHAKFSASLTDKGAMLVRSTIFNDRSNTAVDYNVSAIQTALMSLQLLPSQRKTIDGFWSAASSFSSAIEAEKAKAAKGEKTLPLTHRRFADQANLLVSYYRYLKGDLAELAQLGSVSAGASTINRDAVAVIERSTEHLSEAYGLDQDGAAKQIADLGRVLVDLMNNFSIPLTLNEKSVLIKPIMIKLASRVVPASEAYGDVGARDAVLELKELWEAEAFQRFLEEKLSSSDDKSTNLILNISALTYKLGLSANIEIRTFDAKDVERIKALRGR